MVVVVVFVSVGHTPDFSPEAVLAWITVFYGGVRLRDIQLSVLDHVVYMHVGHYHGLEAGVSGVVLGILVLLGNPGDSKRRMNTRIRSEERHLHLETVTASLRETKITNAEERG